MKFLTPAVRKWAYGVTAAALVVLGVYGVVDGQQLAAWQGLAAALFLVAIANTPTEDSND